VDSTGHVEQTVDRGALRAMQTPQVADKNLLLAALKNALDRGVTVTDECAALELLGARPVITEGSFENIKITTPVDLQFARAVLEGRENP
jgi:2-C-methyl-D-erythritol 4-phosphate cytidylyltransferase